VVDCLKRGLLRYINWAALGPVGGVVGSLYVFLAPTFGFCGVQRGSPIAPTSRHVRKSLASF
jgi:hypothetical protein